MYPAGVQGISTRRVRLRTGISLRLLESGPAGGEPVLLLHGWGACAYMHRFTIRSLGAAGMRAIAVDLRGHGLSDKPVDRAGLYSLDRLHDDIEALVHELGVARYALVGQSMGGKLALLHALLHPDRVSRLVLVSPAGLCPIPASAFASRLSPRLVDVVAPLLVPRWLVSFLLRMTYGDPARVTEHDVDEYWAPAQFPAYARAMRALVREFDWQPLPDDRLGALTVPTLVVVGTRDRLLRRAQEAVGRLPAARSLVVERAGHDVNEEYHELVDAAITGFLGGGVALATGGG